LYDESLDISWGEVLIFRIGPLTREALGKEYWVRLERENGARCVLANPGMWWRGGFWRCRGEVEMCADDVWGNYNLQKKIQDLVGLFERVIERIKGKEEEDGIEARETFRHFEVRLVDPKIGSGFDFRFDFSRLDPMLKPFSQLQGIREVKLHIDGCSRNLRVRRYLENKAWKMMSKSESAATGSTLGG
jgi:hypothetical protein